MKHTPGPWRVKSSHGKWRAVSDCTGSSAYELVLAGDKAVALVVAWTPDPWSDAPPTEHNARLIAAAPDLLEALQKLVKEAPRSVEYSDWPELQELVEKAGIAIAKATGEQK